MSNPNKSPKPQPSVSDLQKILSGETKHSTKARFLSIAEQKRLGIPTESINTSLTFPRKKK